MKAATFSAPSLFSSDEAPIPEAPLAVEKTKVKLVIQSCYDVPKNVLKSIGDKFLQVDMYAQHKPLTPENTNFFMENMRSFIPSFPEMEDIQDTEAQQQKDNEYFNALDSIGIDVLAWEKRFDDKGENLGDKFAYYLHWKCLEENLSLLLSTDAKAWVWKEKAEVLQWVWAPDWVNGRHVAHIPCSFVNCCVLSGLDPDELRDRLINVELVRQLLVAFSMVTERNLPTKRVNIHYKGANPFDSEDGEYEPEERTTYQFPGM